MKARRPGYKKPIWEAKVGADVHRKTGRWSHVEQHIDRLNNRYRKIVVDEDTGEVLRDVDEPLSVHTGRGSAKYAKPRLKRPEMPNEEE